jgi:polyhydroxyalkanoate synthesis repressor PhaR
MDKKKIIIKKYENRRLYDSTHSRYVNLDEVARAVQDGYDVQVLDASTGEDLTRLVMTQIITESAKGPDSVFPLDILREMVVASGKASQESALNYMRVVADMYKDALRGLSHSMSPFEMMQNMMNPASGAQTQAKSANSSEEAKTQESKADTELQELKQRIQELEALVLKRGKAPPRQKKRVRNPANS